MRGIWQRVAFWRKMVWHGGLSLIALVTGAIVGVGLLIRDEILPSKTADGLHLSSLPSLSFWQWAVFAVVVFAIFIGEGAFRQYQRLFDESVEKLVEREGRIAVLERKQPDITLILPEPEMLGVLDIRRFDIGIVTSRDFAPSLATRIFVRAVEPPLPKEFRLPAQVSDAWDDIGVDETRYWTILRTQRGTTNGQPMSQAICSLTTAQAFALDLIHGVDAYLISYKLTARNLREGIDFYCAMKRSVVNRTDFIWDVTWGLGGRGFRQ